MQRRRIGSLEVTVIGLGTNNFGFYLTPDEVCPVVDAALEIGCSNVTAAQLEEADAETGSAFLYSSDAAAS